MNLFPYYYYSFETQLNNDEIKQRLEEITQTPALPFFSSIYYTGYTGGLFQGEISESDFRLKKPRPIPFSGRTPTPVLILGEIIENENGSVVRIKFRLFHYVLLSWIAWMGGIFTVITSNIFINLKNKTMNPFLLILVFALFFGYYIIMVSFYGEVKRVKKIFTSILGG